MHIKKCFYVLTAHISQRECRRLENKGIVIHILCDLSSPWNGSHRYVF